jgi:hypothetical protein
MAITKHIRDNSGAGKEFESVTTSEVTYDTTPQLGSFNPVTSDGVAKAISGASGEVPPVNPDDSGKVLTAGFDGDTPTVSWEDAQGGSVDQSYDPSSANAQSGVAVSEAVSGINAPPVPSVSDEGKTLSVVVYGDTPSMEWTEPPKGSVILEWENKSWSSSEIDALMAQAQAAIDAGTPLYAYDKERKTYAPLVAITDAGTVFVGYRFAIGSLGGNRTGDHTSAIGETGVRYSLGANNFARFDLNIRSLPVPSSSDVNKVLGIQDQYGTLQWVNVGGGDQPLPAIPAYSIRFQFSDTSFDPTTPLAVTNGTWSPVDAGSGIWDFTYQNSDWTDLFNGIITGSNVNGTVDIIGGNMSGVSTAIRLFKYCDRLVNVRIVSPWGDGNADPNLSNMLDGSSAVEIYIDMSGSNMPNGNPYYSYMAHDSPNLRKFTLKSTGSYPSLDHILHDCFALREATIEGFDEIGNAEAMFTSAYNLTKITLTPTQPAIKVSTSAESMFYRTGSAVETIEYPFDLALCNTARGMFAQCTISQLPVLLNTSNVGNFSSFCDTATELRSIPYIDMSSASDVSDMFTGCRKVQSGALDTYTRLTQQLNPPSTTSGCFNNCGLDTVSGKIELAKIPTSYGGLGYENASTASVTLTMNDLVISDSVDVTSITVDSGVTSGIVQWTVASTTTLPTVTDGTNPLKASVNNPASLTVGRTVQVSILNGTWVCAEFA